MLANMETVTIHTAKTNLSKLIARVEAGEEIMLARGDKPVVRMVRVETPAKTMRIPGRLKGRISIDDSFFDPMTEKELSEWE